MTQKEGGDEVRYECDFKGRKKGGKRAFAVCPSTAEVMDKHLSRQVVQQSDIALWRRIIGSRMPACIKEM